MELERRKAQDVALSVETPFSLRGEYWEATYADRIASQAKNWPGKVFENLMHYFNADHLRQAFRQISGSKAKGSDGITKAKYGVQLDENLEALLSRMRSMSYVPAPARLVLIPKPDGKKRPIAISNFEDKLVQKIAAEILTAIYDKGFKPYSYGFRPKRSCHSAIGYLYNKLRMSSLSWVVDIDLKNFFNTIDHGKLMDILKLRIKDIKLLRYLSRMLKAGILVEGNCQESELGTPQGSIVSPILANIYLHHVLDEWFDKTIQPELGGKLVRYADDVVAAFDTEEKARTFVEKLKDRLGEYELELNQEKTRIVFFDRNNEQRATFDFLGFTFYWGKMVTDKRVVLKVKTSARALEKKIQDFVHWIKEARSRYKLCVIWEKISQKLTGHYNYYGVMWNRWKLLQFYRQVIWNAFRWLNRRSQRQSYTWEAFKMRLISLPLPLPMGIKQLINLYEPKLYCR